MDDDRMAEPGLTSETSYDAARLEQLLAGRARWGEMSRRGALRMLGTAGLAAAALPGAAAGRTARAAGSVTASNPVRFSYQDLLDLPARTVFSFIECAGNGRSPADLAPAIAWLRDAAPALPHPALEQAALDHAAFLDDLAAERDLLTRQVLVVVREPAAARGDAPASIAARARRRADEALRGLAALGIPATVLDGPASHQCAVRAGALMKIPFLRTNGGFSTDLPATMQVAARHLVLDAGMCASFAVTGCPAEAGPGRLERPGN